MSDETNMPEMYKIICSLLSRQESAVFREPVDWKGLGLNDYPEIVKKPMDLGILLDSIILLVDYYCFYYHYYYHNHYYYHRYY